MADVIVQPTTVTVTVTSNSMPAPAATTTTLGTVELAGDLAGTAASPTVAKIQGTTIQTPPGVNSKFLAGDGSWQTASAGSGVQIGGDIGGTNTVPQVISTHLSAALPIAQGGTSGATQQAAINALTGAQSAGKYLRSDGANATLATIQAADVPTLNQNTTGTASNVTGVVAIGNGGTGQSSAAAGFNALSPVTALGDLIYGTGSNANGRLAGSTSATKQFLTQTGTGTASAAPAWGGIQAADVPTLNQNTTGTASNVTGTVAIGNGGTGATTAANAVAALGAVATTDCDMLGVGMLTASVFASGFTVLQTAGNFVCCLATPPKTVQVARLGIMVTTAAVTASGVNGLALYSEAGTLIDQTGDLSTAFTNTAPQWAEGSLGATQTLTAGNNYYLCVLTHYSGTEPRFAATGTASSANIPVINGHYPAVFKAAQASFPASFTPSTFTLNSGVYLIYAR